MQNELQEAADAGFDYRGQTVFKSAFGGEEVVVILEKDLDEESTYSRLGGLLRFYHREAA